MLLSEITRWAAPICWLACLATLLVWFGWLAGSLLFVPLLFAGPGLWRGRGYTFAWVSLLSLFYIALGLTEAFSSPAVRGLATAHVLAAYVPSSVDNSPLTKGTVSRRPAASEASSSRCTQAMRLALSRGMRASK